MTLFDALRESHDLQRALCLRLARAKDDSATRTTLLLQLTVELEAHAAAEERHLYVPLLMHDAGLSASRHALAEHHEIEEACEALRVRDKTGPDWLAQAKALSQTVRHHLKEEENAFFQLAGRLLGAAEKRDLARRYTAELLRLRRQGVEAHASLTVDAQGQVRPAE